MHYAIIADQPENEGGSQKVPKPLAHISFDIPPGTTSFLPDLNTDPEQYSLVFDPLSQNLLHILYSLLAGVASRDLLTSPLILEHVVANPLPIQGENFYTYRFSNYYYCYKDGKGYLSWFKNSHTEKTEAFTVNINIDIAPGSAPPQRIMTLPLGIPFFGSNCGLFSREDL